MAENKAQEPKTVPQMDENEIIARKKEKVKTLREEGIHPYANSFAPDSTVEKVVAIPRKKLTQEEIRAEVIALQDMGHKRLALETG